MPIRSCLVLIPVGGGHVDYNVEAASSMEAARKALSAHRRAVGDDDVITVILDGRGLMLAGYMEHNAKQPTYRYRAGALGLGKFPT